MKLNKRLSQNIEDRTSETDFQKLMRSTQIKKGMSNDVLKEPTPLSNQKNLEKKKFKPESNLSIKDSISDFDMVESKDPKPKPFFKHKIKNNLK